MPRTDFYVDILSDVETVTGSTTVVKVVYPNRETECFLVDCGLFQGNDELEKKNKKFIFDPEDIDFVLLTHMHMDHAGRLPLLVKNGFSGNIYMTRTSRKIAYLALMNSAEIQMRESIMPLYTGEDVLDTLKFIEELDYGKEIIKGRWDNIRIKFIKNAHIAGAGIIHINITLPEFLKKEYNPDEEINLIFSGDYKKENMFFVSDDIPKDISEKNTIVICESTYGDTYNSEIQKKFEKDIIKYVKQGKKIIIPCAALFKFQEVLLRLKQLGMSRKLPKIYLDGKLAIDYTSIFSTFEECLVKDILPKKYQIVTDENREAIAKSSKPCIILTTSAMATHGPSKVYIPEALENPNTVIYFISYLAEGTFGRFLVENISEEEIELRNGVVKKYNCVIDQTKELSLHGKREDLDHFITSFKNIKLLILNHGEKEVKEKFKASITNVKNIEILENNKIRVNSYGHVKTILNNP